MSGSALAALKCALRAKIVNFMNFTGLIEVEDSQSRDWASATFIGAQHRVCLRVEGPCAHHAVDALLAGLEEAEFDLGRHILIDIALVADERRDGGDWVRLTLDALTVIAD